MKVNYSLLPMKLHYFFMFGATAPLLPYLPVYMREKLHISYKGIGLIYTLLPFFGFIAKSASGALADVLRIHRAIFLGSIAICGLSFFSICFSPALPTKLNPTPAKIHFDCSSPHSYLRRVFQKHKCSSLKDLKTNSSATCEVSCYIEQNELEEFCQFWNISSAHCSDASEMSTFSVVINLRHTLDDSLEIFFPISNLSYNEEEVNNPRCDHPIRKNCSAKCDSDRVMEFLEAPNQIPISVYSEILDEEAFWIYLILETLAWSAFAICVVMSDTICFKLLGSDTYKYGNQRLFGSIGWGIFVILTGFLIDVTSNESHNKNYTAAFILSLCVACIDFIVALRLKVTGDTKEKSNMTAFLNLAMDPRIMVFILCCFVVGISTGMLWTYQLIYVEEIVHAWDCNFGYMKLLQGLIIGMSCFGGELPFFFISGYFINKLGHVHSMSLVIFVFGLRYILFSVVVNPWLFLPIELLNGFTFGIFYAAMASYASIVAPPGGEATVQGIVGAAFEGLGVAAGGFIGGALFTTVGGSSAFCYTGVFNIVFALIHVTFQVIMNKVKPRSLMGPPAEGYIPPSESMNHVVDTNRFDDVADDADL